MSDGTPPSKKQKLDVDWIEEEYQLDKFIYTYGSDDSGAEDADDDADGGVLDKELAEEQSNPAEESASVDHSSSDGYEASSEKSSDSGEVAPEADAQCASVAASKKGSKNPRDLTLDEWAELEQELDGLPDWFFDTPIPSPGDAVDTNDGEHPMFSDSEPDGLDDDDDENSVDASLGNEDTDANITRDGSAGSTSAFEESSSPSESSSYASSSDDDLTEYATYSDKYYKVYQPYNRRF